MRDLIFGQHNAAGVSTQHSDRRVCGTKRGCHHALTRALQATRLIHADFEDLGTLLASGSEMFLRGISHPSPIYKENRMILEQREEDKKL